MLASAHLRLLAALQASQGRLPALADVEDLPVDHVSALHIMRRFIH